MVSIPPTQDPGARLGFYFWHPRLNMGVKTLPDLTFVEAFPEQLPNASQQTNRAQYLYVQTCGSQWWSGFLFAWDITELTGSKKPVALLDLSQPVVPRMQAQGRDPVLYEIPATENSGVVGTAVATEPWQW